MIGPLRVERIISFPTIIAIYLSMPIRDLNRR